MKAIIINEKIATIIDADDYKNLSTGNLLFRDESLNINTQFFNFKVVLSNDEMEEVRKLAESLVGTNGEVTYYNRKDKSTSVKTVGSPNDRSKSLVKKLSN